MPLSSHSADLLSFCAWIAAIRVADRDLLVNELRLLLQDFEAGEPRVPPKARGKPGPKPKAAINGSGEHVDEEAAEPVHAVAPRRSPKRNGRRSKRGRSRPVKAPAADAAEAEPARSSKMEGLPPAAPHEQRMRQALDAMVMSRGGKVSDRTLTVRERTMAAL